jgi:hypothetical protein
MTVNLSALAGAGQQFFDNSGVILTGGKLYSYAAGTSTPQATYTSASGATPLANPIILDSAGRVPTGEIWLTAGSNYKFALYTSANVLITTWDNITGINGTGITSNASSVQYDPAGTGAVSTTVQAKLREVVSIKDFGAKGDGTTNDTAAFTTALDYCRDNSRTLFIPDGSYLITTKLTRPTNYDITSAEGAKPIYILGESPAAYFNYQGTGDETWDFTRSKYVTLENLSSNKRLYCQAGDYTGLGIYQQLYKSNVRDCQNTDAFSHVNYVSSPRIPSQAKGNNIYPMVIYNNSQFNGFFVVNQAVDASANVLVQGVDGDFSQQSAIAIGDKWPANVSSPIFLISNDNTAGCRPVIQFTTAQTTALKASYGPIAYEMDQGGHISIGCATSISDTNAPAAAALKIRDNTPTIIFFDNANSNQQTSISGSGTFTQINNNFQVINGDARNKVQILNNGTPTANTELGRLAFLNTLSTVSGNVVASVYAGEGTGNNEARLFLTTTRGGSQINTLVLYGNDVTSGTDGTSSNGTAAVRWAVVYAVNGTIQTSDRNEKQDIANLDETEKRVAVRIKSLIKKFRFKDAVAKKGAAARTHFGVIAQDVQQAFEAEGLDAANYGLFCSDTWYEVNGEQIHLDELGHVPENAIQRTRLGVRYDELLAFVIAVI